MKHEPKKLNKVYATKKKPWGQEVWLDVNDRYVLKILEVKAGQELSKQYHKKKTETWYVLEGMLEVVYDKQNFTMIPGDKLHIEHNTVHRMKAVQDSKVLEVSTPEVWDVVRMEDDYGRA